MRRSGDSAASLTRSVGGMALAGSHAAIQDDTIQPDTPNPKTAYQTHIDRAAAGPTRNSPHHNDSNAAMFQNKREPLSPEGTANFDSDEEADSQDAIAGVPLSRYDAASDAPETAPADAPSPGADSQLGLETPNGNPAQPSAAAVFNRSSSRLDRPNSAFGRPNNSTADDFSFAITRPSQRDGPAGFRTPTTAPDGVSPPSIAAFRPDAAAPYQQGQAPFATGGNAAAASAFSKQTMPSGQTVGSGVVASAEFADLLPGLPPRPVQVRKVSLPEHQHACTM